MNPEAPSVLYTQGHVDAMTSRIAELETFLDDDSTSSIDEFNDMKARLAAVIALCDGNQSWFAIEVRATVRGDQS